MARHPTGHPLLLTNRRGHGLKLGLEKRTRDNQCSPAGGSDTRSCCRTTGCSPIRDTLPIQHSRRVERRAASRGLNRPLLVVKKSLLAVGALAAVEAVVRPPSPDPAI